MQGRAWAESSELWLSESGLPRVAFFMSVSFKEILAVGSRNRPLCLPFCRSKKCEAFHNPSEDKLVLEVCSPELRGEFSVEPVF